MNKNFSQTYNIKDSGIGCLLTLIVIGALFSSVGLNWVVNSVLIVIAMGIITPVIAWAGFRWWLNKNLVNSQCPVCGYEFTGFKDTECSCPSCGEPLKVTGGYFQTITPPGTIDVEAVEVESPTD